ncbi:MAG: GGDEF domain-containing protein [Spirochaetia bacterium]|nr:GGDEF domain-containing protein [Spirochaetia bacterium]
MTGDLALKEIAATIKTHIRNVDTVARLGGDEFAIIFLETNTKEVKRSLEKILDFLTGLTSKNKWDITFSIGVVTFLEARLSLENLIDFTDKLMYAVEKNGKNAIAFKTWPVKHR